MNFYHSNRFRAAIAVLLAAMASGCATVHPLRMTAEKAPYSSSVVSPKLAGKKLKKIMVIPPSGTVRGAFETQLVLFEKEFLKRGITVIAGAITGRVVLESGIGGQEKREEGAQGLSDMERALVMAEKTGADAILQIGNFSWSSDSKESRFFTGTAEGTTPFEETDQKTYKSWAGPKYYFSAPELAFIGRVVDVSNGEVVASLDVRMPANFSLPRDYQAVLVIQNPNTPPLLQQETAFQYTVYEWSNTGGVWQSKTSSPWLKDAMEQTEAKVIETAVRQVAAD